MTWKIKSDPESGVIEIVYSGMITKQDSDAATAAVLKLTSGRRPPLVLSNLLAADSHLSIADIYGLPNEWDAAGISRASRMALLVPEGTQTWRDAKFYETTCRNQGWQVAVFSRHADAVGWLTGGRET